MNKLSFEEFKSLLRDGNSLIDLSADHTLTPILFSNKLELDAWLDAADEQDFFGNELLLTDCKRLPFDTFKSEVIIMNSRMEEFIYENRSLTICLFIELYCDYLRLDNFTFEFSGSLDRIINENSDG
jgi:hypothetical protein